MSRTPHGVRSLALNPWLLMTAMLLLATGCASTPAPTNSPTDGLAVEMAVTDTAGMASSYYVVTPDGAIAWGGGRDAMNRRTSWTGALSEDQAQRLVRTLRSDGWLAGSVTSSGTPKSRIAEVLVRWPDGSKRTSLRGESAEVDRLQAVLEEATRARFDDFLRMLPEPTEPSTAGADEGSEEGVTSAVSGSESEAESDASASDG